MFAPMTVKAEETRRRLGWPGVFCGNLELKPMMSRTLLKVAGATASLDVDTNQLTPSLQGGVVREPE